MKVISPKLKAASIAVKKKLYDILQKDANFISQIPNRYEGFQLKPKPYFILEENMLQKIAFELKEKHLNSGRPDEELLEECNQIISLLQKENPVLIFVSLTA